MKLISKKEKLIENIALFGIMSAINVIFVLISTFIPYFLFILVFLLSFSSAVVTLLCNKKYFILYVVATIAICLVINISDTLFFVLPAIISGFLFAVLMEKNVSTTLVLLIPTLVQIAFTYISYYLINAIYHVSIIDTFSIIFKLTDFEYKSFLIAPFIFLISLAQIIFSYIIIESQISKFGFEQKENDHNVFINVFGILLSIGFTVLSIFLIPDFSLLFICFTLWFAISESIYMLLVKPTLMTIILLTEVFIMVLIYALIQQFIQSPFQLVLLESFGAEVAISSLILEKVIFPSPK